MTPDLALDLRSSAWLEPLFEDRRGRSTIGGRQAHDDLVALSATDPLDGRAAGAAIARQDAQSVEVAAEPDRGPVAKPTSGRQHGSLPGVPGDVSTQPDLTLGEERPDVSTGVRPTAATRNRHGHDDPAIGMDDDPQAARTR